MQLKGILQSWVSNENGEALNDVLVEILTGSWSKLSDETDADGFSQIENIPPKPFAIRYTLKGKGYQPWSTGASFKGALPGTGKTVQMSIVLRDCPDCRLFGWVWNRETFGIPDAIVEIKDVGRMTKAYKDGAYEMCCIPMLDLTSTYSVAVSAPGYVKLETQVKLRAGNQWQQKNFTLYER